jgi:hypothetical protein
MAFQFSPKVFSANPLDFLCPMVRLLLHMVDLSAHKTNNLSSINLRLNSSICTKPLFQNRAFLNQKYCVEKLSARRISILIGCAHSTINDALETFGLTKEHRRGGWTQYGDKLTSDGKVKHTRQRKIILWMLRRKQAKWSNARIADALNAKKIPSPAGKRKWYPATVGKIIKRNASSE